MIHKLPRWIILGAFILAMVAGLINSVSLVSHAQVAVSHMTGNIGQVSQILVGIDGSNPFTLWVVLAFLGGAMISGLVIGGDRLVFGRRYGVALLIQSGLLLGAWFGYRRELMLGAILAASACGLQNAMVATYSGAVIRTTHLTGVLSDLGQILGNRIRGNKVPQRQLILLLEILAGFVAGGMLGAGLYPHLGANVLLLPIVLSFLSGASYLAWRLWKGRGGHAVPDYRFFKIPGPAADPEKSPGAEAGATDRPGPGRGGS